MNEISKKDRPDQLIFEMVCHEIRSDTHAIAENRSLYMERNFTGRAEAIDFSEFHVIDRIEGLLQNTYPQKELISLMQLAETTKLRLEKINADLFKKLRADIENGNCRGWAFRQMTEEYFGYNLNHSQNEGETGYDNLDVFTNSLLDISAIPEETKEREPEMVFYQKTPARIVFELADKADFNKEDVFYDLGSGLGQVPILLNLLCGVAAKGIEFETAYCNYAAACADELNLPDVQFINADARAGSYSDGTIFFLYTPFEGSILQKVLEVLHSISKKKKILLFTYGPCTLEVARERWLNREDQGGNNIYKLGVFRSQSI